MKMIQDSFDVTPERMLQNTYSVVSMLHVTLLL